jgi:hypothetical protein
LRSLLGEDPAITEMVEVMTQTHKSAARLGVTCQLQLSDQPDTAQPPALYLSHHTYLTPSFARLRDAGTDVWHFGASDMRRRITLDPEGFGGWSSLAHKRTADLVLGDVTADEISDFFTEAHNKARAQAAHHPQSDAPLDLPANYVLVALQTIGHISQRKAYVPMLDMLSMVVERFAGSGTTVVIRRHPKCNSRKVAVALARVGGKAGVMVTDEPLHRILDGAQALFTVNSSAGASSLAHDVPLYCFGASDVAPVAHYIRSPEDLLAATTPIRFACPPEQRARFVFYYRNIFQVDLDNGLAHRLDTLISAALRKT